MLLRDPHNPQGPPDAPPAPQRDSAPAPFPAEPREPFDLRRAVLRRHADTILARAWFLAPDDRALIYAVFRDHMSVERLARAAAVRPERLRGRVRRLLRRLYSARFVWALSARRRWSPERRRIADGAIFQGLSQRAIARRLQISLARVRIQLNALRALEEAALQPPHSDHSDHFESGSLS